MAEKTADRPGAVSLTRPVSLLRHLGYVVKSMRPKQWTKNGIVGMAFLFSIHMAWEPDDPSSCASIRTSGTCPCAVASSSFSTRR